MSGDAFDPAILAEIRRPLAAIDELVSRREIALKSPVDPGSPAEADRALPEARFITAFAGHASSAAIDHLTAWRLLAHGPLIPVGAHLTLTRGALENAVRCRWHVDLTVEPADRVARAYAARRKDQADRAIFDASPEPEPRWPIPPGGKTGAQRVADLDDPDAVRIREEAGVPIVGYTDTTSLMKHYGRERWYRISSGLAHGKEWALMATNIRTSAEPSIVPRLGHGIVSSSEPITRDLTFAAVDEVAAAVADLEAYRTSGLT